jgi:hypothetical protein
MHSQQKKFCNSILFSEKLNELVLLYNKIEHKLSSNQS